MGPSLPCRGYWPGCGACSQPGFAPSVPRTVPGLCLQTAAGVPSLRRGHVEPVMCSGCPPVMCSGCPLPSWNERVSQGFRLCHDGLLWAVHRGDIVLTWCRRGAVIAGAIKGGVLPSSSASHPFVGPPCAPRYPARSTPAPSTPASPGAVGHEIPLATSDCKVATSWPGM